MEKLNSNRNFWLVLLLILVTCGIYAFYIIYAFAKETNIVCKDDGKKTTGLFLYIVYSILTLGIYGVVWFCKWINRCNAYLSKNGKPEGLQLSTFLWTVFLFNGLTLGIMGLVVFAKQLKLQNAVNATYNEKNNL